MPHQLLWTDTDESVSVPNMCFTVLQHGEFAPRYEFSIYTVQVGMLINQRIIKYRTDSSRTFKGFAFLMSDGSIKIWRSQLGIDDIIPALAKGGIEAINNGNEQFYDMGYGWSIETCFRTCLRCNTALDTPYGYWCHAHVNALVDHRRSIESDENVTRYAQQRARRVVSSAGASFHARHAAAARNVVDAAAEAQLVTQAQAIREASVSQSRDVRTLPLSENGTGLVR